MTGLFLIIASTVTSTVGFSWHSHLPAEAMEAKSIERPCVLDIDHGSTMFACANDKTIFVFSSSWQDHARQAAQMLHHTCRRKTDAIALARPGKSTSTAWSVRRRSRRTFW